MSERSRLEALPDEPARRAIHEDLETTILVEAAAGTGKTESLVDRMVALIRSGKTTIDRIAAVTFTIKAAAELSERFQTRLEDTVRSAETAERGRVEEALSRLDTAFIGTIHAFCARLLRERPVEAGVAPGFAEMDEPENAAERREAWDRHTERLFAEESPLLARLAALGVRLEDLRETFETLSDNEDVAPSIGRELPTPSFEVERRAVEVFLEQAEAALPEQVPAGGWNEFQQAVRRALRLHTLFDMRETAEFVRALEALDRVKKRQKEAGPLGGALETLCRETIDPALRRWREHLHPILMGAVVPAVTEYRQWRRRSGKLNFQDLLLLARDLLRDNPQVRRAFQGRFLPILVDEFQDTDPIQAEILFYLTGKEIDSTDWRRLTPLPGSLFVVGDPKQSIYRFRRADILTYNLVRQRIEETGGRILHLTTNFRSTGQICQWINTVFSAIFPQAPTPEQAAYVPLDAARPQGDRQIFRLETTTSTSAFEPVIDQDAERIARFVAGAIGRAEHTPGDFLVLFRQRKYMPVYARALEARGIPYELAGGGAFEDSEELRVLMPLLHALADPDNPVFFVAALRGPLFGVDDEALYRFSRAGGRFSFRAPPPDTADPRIVAAYELLREGEEWIQSLPPGAAIARLSERLGWIACGAARELGDSRAGNLLKAIAAAREISARGLEFAGVVREIDRMTREGYIEEMSAEPGRRDVVRLLTVHGAKGLQAPVVFLADPTRKSDRAPRTWIDRRREPAQGHWLVMREAERYRIELARPTDWEEMAGHETAFEEAEKARLLYVAATRARERLVVSIWKQGKGKAQGTWARLDPFLKEHLPEPSPPPPSSAPPGLEGVPKELLAFRQRRAERLALSNRPTYSVTPVTDLAHRQGPLPTWERTGRGMSWGRVLHGLLEALMKDSSLDVRGYAANLLAEEERPPEDLEEAVRWIERVRTSPIWQRALDARRRLVEIPFALNVPRADLGLTEGPSETLLSGAIDLAF
ncbi:MAG TPA: UvrD-helicase domain-containing protein, partial [Thermoanaerobaculia bacterium]|nr:UvrD-helicase domain-containing protein [Thermoanaerobaculia bacterium]